MLSLQAHSALRGATDLALLAQGESFPLSCSGFSLSPGTERDSLGGGGHRRGLGCNQAFLVRLRELPTQGETLLLLQVMTLLRMTRMPRWLQTAGPLPRLCDCCYLKLSSFKGQFNCRCDGFSCHHEGPDRHCLWQYSAHGNGVLVLPGQIDISTSNSGPCGVTWDAQDLP